MTKTRPLEGINKTTTNNVLCVSRIGLLTRMLIKNKKPILSFRYSRRILWLEVSHTNNDPCVVGNYFVECVEQIGGAPVVVRGDCGTENVYVAGIQRFLRRECQDDLAGFKSFMYGTSVANQRIEAWWAYLRRSSTTWWINMFKELRDQGLFDDSDVLHVECLRFCFMQPIQVELHRVARHWNTHKIRPYSHQETPHGKPDVLFFLPQLKDTRDYKTLVDREDMEVVRELYCKERTEYGCSDEIAEFFIMLMEENGISNEINTPEEARELYLVLLTLSENEL